jgi:ABC-type enterochelin transport system permease subunit
MRCNGAVLWSAKTLKVVTDSTAHAETAEASRATKSVMFVRMVLVGISRGAVGPTAVLGDNSAMVELVTKEGASSRTRHFERATVLIKYAVLQLIVTVHLISTKFMCADVFTKATDEQTFKTMRSVLRNEPSPDGYAIRAARWINTLMRVSSPV